MNDEEKPSFSVSELRSSFSKWQKKAIDGEEPRPVIRSRPQSFSVSPRTSVVPATVPEESVAEDDKPSGSVADLRRSFIKSMDDANRPQSGAGSVSPTSGVSPRTSVVVVPEEPTSDDDDNKPEPASSVADLRRSFIKQMNEGARPLSGGAWSYTQGGVRVSPRHSGVSPRTSALVNGSTMDLEEEEDERARLPPVKLIGFEGVGGPPPGHALYPTVNPDMEDSTTVDVPVSVTNINPIGFEGTVAGVDNEGYDGDASAAIPPADPMVDNGLTAGKPDSSLNGSRLDEGIGNAGVKAFFPTKELAEKRETLFFRDGVRSIDYILVYKDTSDESKKQKRETFERNLEEEGLELEYEDKRDKKSNFVKIHAPWETLTKVAEILALKMPIKMFEENDLVEFQEGCCSKFPNPFALSTDLVPEEPDCFTADFSREREHMFIIKDHETFFTNAQRSIIVYELLLRTKYHTKKKKVPTATLR